MQRFDGDILGEIEVLLVVEICHLSVWESAYILKIFGGNVA